MDIACLKDYGIDYEKGLARCLGDQSFYEMILSLFLQDASVAQAKEALSAKDARRLFNAMHELKGACGNAELTELYAAVCRIVELLRPGTASEAEILPVFQEVEKSYERAKAGIRAAGVV